MRVNEECMYRFNKEFNYNFVEINKDKRDSKSQDIILSENMPILCKRTNKKLNILNSEIFKVIKISSTHFTIINGEKEKVDIEIKNFHKLFYPGFCITVYASQGETYKEKYSIYDWNFKYFDNRAKYVAMSRSSHIDHIQIA